MRDVEVLRAVDERMRQLRAAHETTPTEEATEATSVAETAKAVLSQLVATTGTSAAVARLTTSLREAMERPL